MRIVYGANFRDHTDVIFQDLKFLKFYDLVKLKICEVMYRAFNKTLPVNLNNIFTVCEPNCLFNPFAFTNCVCIGLAVFAFKALEIPCLFAFSGGKTQKCKYYY